MLGCLILIHGRFKDLVTFHQEVASARPLGERGNPIERRRRHDSALVIWQAPAKDIALSPVQFESRSRAQSRNAPDGCPCMHGQFHPELVGQRTANVDEIRERCL
jgi:hypothetical protein